MHKKHGSMLKEDAMLEYVKIVENIFPYRFFTRNGDSLIHITCESFYFFTADLNKTFISYKSTMHGSWKFQLETKVFLVWNNLK